MMDDPYEQHVLSSVEKYGWAVLAIPEDEEGPPFAYSVGIFRTLGQPEVVMIGQKLETMHGILNHVGGLMREGRRFADGELASGVLVGYEACFVAVGREHYPEYFGYARWFYQGDDFPVLQ